jgi:hypothetical protein
MGVFAQFGKLVRIRNTNMETTEMMDPAVLFTNDPTALSSGAERMRRHRQRRHDGLRCLQIQLRETEIDELIRKGMLKSETRNDRNAIIRALYAFFDASLNGTR